MKTIEEDWRKRPRKDRRSKRSQRIEVRVTPAEHDSIYRLADKSSETVSDYVVRKALDKRQRLATEDEA